MKKKVMYLLLVACFLLSTVNIVSVPVASATTQATYYVSPTGSDSNSGTQALPFLTIQKARDVVSTINSNMTGDIIVYLRGGTYTQTATLAFDQTDSGTNGYNVIYKNYTGEVPVISGGKAITGWTLFDATKNIYKSSAVSGGIETRQLYVNDVRVTRAQSTAAQTTGYGFVKTSTGYTTTDSNLQNWGNRSDIEVKGHNAFLAFRGGVSSIAGTTITMQDPFWTEAQRGVPLNLPDYLENAYELLDAEGEWYLDRPTDVFYYKPKAGENMATAVVIAPVLETLVKVEGTLDSPIRNIRFEGVTFSHATWLTPSTGKGIVPIQANFTRWNGSIFEDGLHDFLKSPANIVVRTGMNITFERCKFNKLGGVGMDVEYGSQNNIISGNEFSDISNTGIQIGDIQTADHHPTDIRTIVKNNAFTNNYVHNVAVEYQGGVGVFVGITESTTIAHNYITDVPYSGISMGWGWGGLDYYDNPRDFTSNNTPSTAKDNKILNNHILNFMQALEDGGGIYTFGSQPGLVSAGNVVHLVTTPGPGTNSPGNMYYQDFGSQHQTVKDNLLYNDGPNGIGTWFGYNHNLINNYLSDLSSLQNAAGGGYIGGNQWYQTDSATVYNNNTSEGVPAYILDNAGLESAYQDLLPSPALNFALGKTVTGRDLNGNVSSMVAGHEAKYAVDGNIVTYAQATTSSWAWMEDVDLGKSYNISKVRVNFTASGFATQYDILTSPDGTTWTTKAQITNNTSGGWKEHSFTGTDTRYIRVKMIMPNASGQTGGQAAINEIEAIGKLSVGTTPDTFPTTVGVPVIRDIAQQKTATARYLDGSVATMQSGREAGMAIDGDSATYAQASGQYPWMEDVDLGTVSNVSRVKINFLAGGFATAYDVLVSLDNTTWTTVTSVTGNTTGGWKEHTFDPKAARYVRLKMITPDGPNQTGVQACLSDFEVYRYNNLEHKKTATARYLDGSIATMQTGHGADQAIDAQEIATNVTPSYAQASGQYPWMLDVDLGGVFEGVESVVVGFLSGGFATDLDILVSVDNINWTTVKQVTGTTNAGGEYIFNHLPARYVRLKMLKPDGPNQTGVQACVVDFRIYERNDTAFIASTRTDGNTGNHNLLHNIASTQYLFQTGDVVEYDVMLLSNETEIGGLDILNTDPTKFRDYTWNDQNGIGGYIGDIRSKAYLKWYHRVLPIPTQMVGKTSNHWDIVFENDSLNKTFQVVYDNIVVKRNGAVVQTIYKEVMPISNSSDIRTYYDIPTISSYGRYDWGRLYWANSFPQ